MISIPTIDGKMPLPNGLVWSSAIISILVVLAFYVLRSLGLYKLAKRGNVKNAFIAWIPFVWMYTACVVIGKEKCFGRPFEKLAVLFCVIFSVTELISFITNFIIWFPVVGNFLEGREIILGQVIGETNPNYTSWFGVCLYKSNVADPFKNPYGVVAYDVMEKTFAIMSPITMILQILNIVVLVNVYISLFRKYWPQHHMLFGMLSLFLGLFPVFVFVIRNREPISYNDYLKSRYNQMYYGSQNNPNGPYTSNPNMNGGADPFSDQFSNKNSGDPFTEFANKEDVDPGDPFADFNKKNDEDNK